jgi:hypothetical protein
MIKRTYQLLTVPISHFPWGFLVNISLQNVVSRAAFGIASNSGGRPYQDDRSTAFSTRLPDGTRVSVGAVLDGHHGHQIAELIAERLPAAFLAAVAKWPGDLESALVSPSNSIIIIVLLYTEYQMNNILRININNYLISISIIPHQFNQLGGNDQIIR